MAQYVIAFFFRDMFDMRSEIFRDVQILFSVGLSLSFLGVPLSYLLPNGSLTKFV